MRATALGTTLGLLLALAVPSHANFPANESNNVPSIGSSDLFLNSPDKPLRFNSGPTATIEPHSDSPVAIARPSMSIIGSLVAGERLTLEMGSWGEGVSLALQWFSGGKKIAGANRQTYTITSFDVGKELSVQVTASRTGAEAYSENLKALGVVSPEPNYPRSQGLKPEAFTTYGIRDFDSAGEQTSNFKIFMKHDATLACLTSCQVSAQITLVGTIGTSFASGSILLRDSNRNIMGSRSVFMSANSMTSSVNFVLASSQFQRSGERLYLSFEPSSMPARRVFAAENISEITLIKPPTGSEPRQIFPERTVVFPSFAEETAGASGLRFFEYAVSNQVNVSDECSVVRTHVTPLGLASATADGSANYAADATLTLRNASGQTVDRVSITGGAGEWSKLDAGSILDLKACGLNSQKGKKVTLRLTLDLSYDDLDQNFTTTRDISINAVGSLQWTRINCYKGTAGRTVFAYEPECPKGWKATSAKVVGNKVQIKTLNCLKGTTVKVIKSPEPKCPSGFKQTKLKVSNGKLATWTITCTKGVLVKKVSGVFPRCPSGYKKR
jgi:hypothetical protein